MSLFAARCHAVRLHLGKQRGHAVAVEQVHLVEMHLGRARHELAPAEEEVVDAVDLVAVAEETREQICSDEAGRAGEDDLHDSAARVRASSSGVPMSKKS